MCSQASGVGHMFKWVVVFSQVVVYPPKITRLG